MSKKQKQPSLKELQKKIWEECKRIIKIRYGNDCYTCGVKNLKGSNRHTGHLIPKKYLPYQMKYDLRLLRPQCYNCNMNLGGMGAIFIWKLLWSEDIDVGDIMHDLEKYKKEKVTKKQICEYYSTLLSFLKLLTK